ICLVPFHFLLFLYCPRPPPDLHSFPTRRSSDLEDVAHVLAPSDQRVGDQLAVTAPGHGFRTQDRRGSGPRELPQPRQRLLEPGRSEEHTSELQSLAYLVCRLLLEKKKKKQIIIH